MIYLQTFNTREHIHQRIYIYIEVIIILLEHYLRNY